MLLIALVFLIAAALSWAWLKDPPSAPNPSATGTPASVPQGGGGS